MPVSIVCQLSAKLKQDRDQSSDLGGSLNVVPYFYYSSRPIRIISGSSKIAAKLTP